VSARFLFAIAAFAACNSAPRTSATPSAAASDSMPLRFAPSNGVITVNFGTLRDLTVRPPFTYVGGQRFILGGTADAEQHLYVVADSAKVVKRMYWIQIEEVLPTASHRYDYSSDSLVSLSGFNLRAHFRTYRTPATPLSDQGRAFGLVTARGYTIPMGGTRIRLIHLPEVPSSREVMLIYFESDPGAATDAHASLLARAADGITLRSR
jgi:hypothetical protein